MAGRTRRSPEDRRAVAVPRSDTRKLTQRIDGLATEHGEPLADESGVTATFVIEAGTLLVCRAVETASEQLGVGIGTYALVETILKEDEDGSSLVQLEEFNFPLGKRITRQPYIVAFNDEGEEVASRHPDFSRPKGFSPSLWAERHRALLTDMDEFLGAVDVRLYRDDFLRLSRLAVEAGAHNLSTQHFDAVKDRADC